jgi:hypothetical protein
MRPTNDLMFPRNCHFEPYSNSALTRPPKCRAYPRRKRPSPAHTAMQAAPRPVAQQPPVKIYNAVYSSVQVSGDSEQSQELPLKSRHT